eukprot:CAMPEP_0170072392 /NCGR_PEP_ID=MMETSP0019_2-20121128/10044_1 /TAXON_ID=98059 /ORGANISM="Dinobryon sp., Strain UTEXLB2267" /LENGTH=49 /DNA_ID=CAMNT_0010281345 /DNA_START=598 /DNA_END=747 /DNA_ORIENTATION=+
MTLLFFMYEQEIIIDHPTNSSTYLHHTEDSLRQSQGRLFSLLPSGTSPT